MPTATQETEKKELNSDPNHWTNRIDYYAREGNVDISDLVTASIIKKAQILENEISKLLRDIIDRRDQIELNFGPSAKKTKEEIVHLRELYAQNIDNGEAVKADEILDRIKTMRQKLKTEAKKILSASDDFLELEKTQREIYEKALALIKTATTNWIVAQILEETARVILSNASDSTNHYLGQLKDESEKSKKIASRILSE